MTATPDAIKRAADTIARADALVVTAGAGLGVDSGLPDFRGTEGFWAAYPPYARLGLRFEQLASPRWFREDPALAWGFYGHRLDLYRATAPHEGFAVLRRWATQARLGGFVVTSNVDGQFARAGFDPDATLEVHGSIHHAQCALGCGVGVFPADGFRVTVDPETFRAEAPFPTCPACGGPARPNVLMFGDDRWDEQRTNAQGKRFVAWLGRHGPDAKLAVVELGAGTAVATVPRLSEQLARRPDAALVRVNPREPEVPRGLDAVGLTLGAADALRRLDALVARS